MRHYVTIRTDAGLRVVAETTAEPVQMYEYERGAWQTYNDPLQMARSVEGDLSSSLGAAIMTDERLLASPGGPEAMALWRAGNDEAYEAAMWVEAERAMDTDLRIMFNDNGDPEAERLLTEGASWGVKARHVHCTPPAELPEDVR